MNIVSINGMTITSNGSITVTNGRVIVDGKDVTPEGKEINITVNGNIQKLEVDVCSKLLITGDVQDIRTKSGDVEVSGEVKGNIQTMSGDVDCGNVNGSISTMSGDIKNREYKKDFPSEGKLNWKRVKLKTPEHSHYNGHICIGVVLHDGNFIINGVMFREDEYEILDQNPLP